MFVEIFGSGIFEKDFRRQLLATLSGRFIGAYEVLTAEQTKTRPALRASDVIQRGYYFHELGIV